MRERLTDKYIGFLPNSCLLNIYDLMVGLNKINAKSLSKHASKEQFVGACRTILIHLFKMVLEDVAETGCEYHFASIRPAILYVDTVTGDEYKELYKKGKFLNVDPVEANFTGKILKFKIKRTDGYFKNIDVHVTRYIREKIEKGIVREGPKIKTYHDYVDLLRDRLLHIPMTIIKNAIRHMEVRIVKYVLAGGGVNIQTSYSEGLNFYDFAINYPVGVTIGLKRVSYIRRMKVKLRKRYIAKYGSNHHDGYYYFALTDKQVAEVVMQDKTKTRKNFTFTNIMLYKLFEECVLRRFALKNIFRVPIKLNKGWTIYKDILRSSEFEYLYFKVPEGLQRVNATTDVHNSLFNKVEIYRSQGMKWIPNNVNYKWIKLNVVK